MPILLIIIVCMKNCTLCRNKCIFYKLLKIRELTKLGNTINRSFRKCFYKNALSCESSDNNYIIYINLFCISDSSHDLIG